ncbi:hypothetical protein AVEN_102943-1 [Araneus ventricosus]|uniref:Uncharacterized protein n=1 Tax=Araneus ventricosus TaxID=182803 RepID=A0A4Y2A420_ARAVE|nr:hypothetical protein AVEN_102943-1 [Araneus ventricosus]
MYEEITIKIEEIWYKASIPILLHDIRILTLIRREHEKILKLIKSYFGRKDSPYFQKNIQAFREETIKLPDVAACKCLDIKLCQCDKSRKVPLQEQQFITDQRSARAMTSVTVEPLKSLKKLLQGRRKTKL